MRVKVFRWVDPVFLMYEAPATLTVCETAGWIVEEDEETIVIASERLTEPDGSIKYRQFTRVARSILRKA